MVKQRKKRSFATSNPSQPVLPMPERSFRLTFPDLLTFANLGCGVLALFFLSLGNTTLAALLILLGVVFDYFDGKVARLLDQESKLGEYLDSFADLITFGVAVGFLFYHTHASLPSLFLVLFFIGAGAYRLARYHLLKAQGFQGYLGMPITMNGIVFPLLLLFSVPSVFLVFWIGFSTIAMVSSVYIKKIG
ncbi:MAG: CDP-alcohol phosphatidyltransferase family protein [Candidatus Woesearchaeota archaeon]